VGTAETAGLAPRVNLVDPMAELPPYPAARAVQITAFEEVTPDYSR
jgi:hypothetical protein